MKLLVLCPPDFKRSPLVRKLRTRTMVPVRDLETEVLDRNGGMWPGHYPKVVKQLEEQVLTAAGKSAAIIMTAGSPSFELLEKAVENGFTVVCVRAAVVTPYTEEVIERKLVSRILDGSRSLDVVDAVIDLFDIN